MPITFIRKRPCRVCRRWFYPDVRLKERQKTCGKVECKREWHKKKCAEWNRKNADYFKANYLQKKIDAATQCGDNPEAALPINLPPSRMNTGMPREYVKEIIGARLVIIQEYLAQLLDRRYR